MYLVSKGPGAGKRIRGKNPNLKDAFDLNTRSNEPKLCTSNNLEHQGRSLETTRSLQTFSAKARESKN